MKRLFTLLLVAGLFLSSSQAARATFLSGLIRTGFNTASDNSIETYFDVAGTNKFQGESSPGANDGTVIAGVVQINKVNGTAVDQHLFAVFSQQVKNITPTGPGGTNVVHFQATAVPALTLSALAGNAAIPAGSTFAFFSVSGGTGYANNVLTTAGATAVGGGAATNNISKLMTYVASTGGGTAEFATGFVAATDLFQASVAPAGSPLLTDLKGTLATTPSSQQFASPIFAQGTTDNFTGFTFLKNVPVTTLEVPPVTVTSQVSLTQAGASGGFQNGFVDLPLFSGNLPLAAGGGIDNGTFVFDVPAATVPEPTSLVLFGVGFAGLAGVRLVRRKKGAVAV